MARVPSDFLKALPENRKAVLQLFKLKCFPRLDSFPEMILLNLVTDGAESFLRVAVSGRLLPLRSI